MESEAAKSKTIAIAMPYHIARTAHIGQRVQDETGKPYEIVHVDGRQNVMEVREIAL